MNQVSLVTGATSGIGRAIAGALAREGAEICIVGRRYDALQAVAEEVCRNGGHPHTFRTDLTNDDDLRSLADSVAREFGKLDVLVLCGGAIIHGSLESSTLGDFDLQYRSNVRSHCGLTQLLLPMLRSAQGQIVFINSSAGLRFTGTSGQYSATQHALRAIADSLRDEVNKDGIRVLSVYPGRTATPRTKALFEREGRSYRPDLLMQPEDVASIVTYALALRRTAEVTDINIRSMKKCY